MKVYPSELTGTVAAPGSKSAAQRMVACALLARGESTIREFPDSDDCVASLSIAKSLGAIISQKGNTVTIKGGFPDAFRSGIRNPDKEIMCGESGLSSRMFTPIVALSEDEITIEGHGTLLKRSFADFEKILPVIGAQCTTNNGLLPLKVKGPLQGGELEMDGAMSSQFLTGVLTALARANSASTVTVNNLTSKPYVDMTLEILKEFEVEVTHEDYRTFHVKPMLYKPKDIMVPGDWSGAAFLLVAGALCAPQGITITNLSTKITQADAAILEVLKLAGVDFTIKGESVTVKESEIHAFEFDANQCPDLFPPIVALAAFADGVSTIYGIKRLVHKESNRAKTLQQEFAKANIRITLRDDEMKVYPASVRPAIINSHNDHRIAMAGAVLGLAGDRMTIRGAEAVAKSFPTFFEVIKELNAKVSS
jgi:3-phosphoshikimate 1-carboxyvinyltransferase